MSAGDHQPEIIHFGDRYTWPAEVCSTCSDEEAGVWVPVTFCPIAAAQIDDSDPLSEYAMSGVLVREHHCQEEEETG